MSNDYTKPFSTATLGCLVALGLIVVAFEWCGERLGLIDGQPDTPVSTTTSTLCGASDAMPTGIPTEAWRSYTCQTEGQRRGDWSGCLTRSAYTDNNGAGCPGASNTAEEQRCCPPRGP